MKINYLILKDYFTNPKTQTMTKKSNFQQLQARTKELLQTIKTVIQTPELHDKELLKTSLESVESLIEAFEKKLADSRNAKHSGKGS